jgi:hypothetical protein
LRLVTFDRGRPMFEMILAVMILSSVYLGVRAFMKFREIARWNSEDQVENKRSNLPQDLIELKIDDPSSDSLDSPPSRGDQDPPKRESPQ